MMSIAKMVECSYLNAYPEVLPLTDYRHFSYEIVILQNRGQYSILTFIVGAVTRCNRNLKHEIVPFKPL
jgi:hypothetical protein